MATANPTDTARALVERFEKAVQSAANSDHQYALSLTELADARAALLAHVDTLRIERDGFKELYEEWLTWAKGAVERCKPEIQPSDSPQAQGIIDERLAHVAGEKAADKARLDWIEAQFADHNRDCNLTFNRFQYDQELSLDAEGASWSRMTIRSSLDAARGGEG